MHTMSHAIAAPAGHRRKGRIGAMLATLLPVAGLFCASAVAAQEADGERLFRQRCAACHAMEAGQDKIGPRLLGVFGRAAGSLEGVNYSNAMQSSGITWDRRSLDTFLAAPRQVIRGTRMTVSVPDPAQRAAIIDYLQDQSTD